MSWRRFSVLVRCLSPGSATVARVSQSRQFGKKDAVRTVIGPKAAQDAFDLLFKNRPSRASAQRT